MADELQAALLEHQAAFGVDIPTDALSKIVSFYDLLISRNDILHLVAPCSAEEFAVRHILESIFVADLLPAAATVADIGSGGGLPGIPLAVFREDLKLILIESKEKKARFLAEAAETCGIGERVEVVAKQFGESAVPAGAVITARALDKFAGTLPRLVKWAAGRRMVLFAGPSLEEALVKLGIRFRKTLIPMSEQRFVFETV